MSDNKKYYYLKLKEDFFDSPEIKVLESMPNGYKYSNLLLKLYLIIFWDLGSKISLIASPNKLKQRTAIKINAPGVRSQGR